MPYLSHSPFDAPPAPKASAPAAPMDPRARLQRHGPLRPMERRPSLIERILFS
jgi:hypothetical protein